MSHGNLGNGGQTGPPNGGGTVVITSPELRNDIAKAPSLSPPSGETNSSPSSSLSSGSISYLTSRGFPFSLNICIFLGLIKTKIIQYQRFSIER